MQDLLVVHEDETLALPLIEQFESMGFEVEWSESVDRAVQDILRWRPDLVVVPVDAQERLGGPLVEALRELSADEGFLPPVFIFDSAENEFVESYRLDWDEREAEGQLLHMPLRAPR